MTMPSMDDNFPFRADYVAYEVEPHHGDPTIYLTVGDGYPAYQHRLIAEPSNIPSMNIQPADLLLFHERFQTEPIVNRALEALGDRGISADVLRLRQFPGRRRALQEMKNQITRLEDFVLKERQRYYKRDQDLIDEEKEVRDRLVQAKAVERMEPYLHFFDDHGHLQNLTSRNNIIRGGWEDLLDGIVYGHDTPPPRLPMPEDDASSSSGPGVRFDLPENEHEVNHRRLRARCKYCNHKGHFNFECRVPHKLCHFQGRKKCLVPTQHRFYKPAEYPVCAYDGVHSVRMWKQRQRAVSEQE